MTNKYVNNHYIQKALAKNWANENGDIFYILHNDFERKKFNIEDKNENHPISSKHFYSIDIEQGMNEIENDGINVIKKIINNYNKNNITLFRKEVVALKFYLILSEIRTKKYRINIEQKTGDSLFNKCVEDSRLTPQEIQEEQIKKIINLYYDFKNNNPNSEFVNEYKEHLSKVFEFSNLKDMNIDNIKEFEYKNTNIINILYTHFFTLYRSTRLIFIKFDTQSLILSDANSFCEYYPDYAIFYNQPIYYFYPISPNIGVILYNNELSEIFYPNYSSKIFGIDLKNSKNKNKYKNNKLNEGNIDSSTINKYKDDMDEYNYTFINKSRDVAILCNAMMMVHINNITLFKNYKDISEAKEKVKELGIFRKENYC